MNVSTGTLRNIHRKRKRLQTLTAFDPKPAGSFKAWIKLNVKLIMKHYDDRPGFTLAAGKLLEV